MRQRLHLVNKISDSMRGKIIVDVNQRSSHIYQKGLVTFADGGNWYYSEDFTVEGWLCPALFKYFDKAPEEIYAKFEEKEERGQG